MQKELDALVREVLPLDRSAMTAAEAYQARLAKPPGSLGRLEEISIQLAGITGRVHNALNKKQLLVFAADNGVVAEGVSSAPQSVTKQQTINLMRGKTGAAVLAKHFGCGLTVCDVGVNADIYESTVLNRKIAYGTQNICTGPAMTREQTLQAILTGAEIARTVDADVIGVGEMGIGNTTTSSAVLAVLLGADVEAVTGRGGGITEESFRKKKAVIRTAIEVNRPNRDDVIDVLAKVGGFDLAAMCGAFLGAAASRRAGIAQDGHHRCMGTAVADGQKRTQSQPLQRLSIIEFRFDWKSLRHVFQPLCKHIRPEQIRRAVYQIARLHD